MKVLQIVRQYKPAIGGLENFVSDLSAHLKTIGIHSDVLTLNRNFSDNSRLPDHSVINDVNVRRIPYFGSHRYPIATAVLKHVQHYDLVHVHAVDFFIDYLSLTKWFHKKPIILSTHGGFFHTQNNKRLKQIYFRTITRSSLKRVDRVIANSQNDYDIFKPVTGNNLTLVENAINVDFYASVSGQRCHRPNFIFIGRFAHNKRVDLLIKLIHLLKPHIPDITLTIVGREYDHLRGSYEELIRQYRLQDNVEIRESLTEEALLRQMANAKYFISASEYEGFGLSALEAMAAGKICFLSDIPSFKKLVHDGENGFILNFCDLQDAKEKVMAVLSEPNHEAIIRSSIQRSQQYAWPLVVKSFADVYQEVFHGQ